jgi:hypothetical protein
MAAATQGTRTRAHMTGVGPTRARDRVECTTLERMPGTHPSSLPSVRCCCQREEGEY